MDHEVGGLTRQQEREITLLEASVYEGLLDV